jgi:hypothetical protein
MRFYNPNANQKIKIKVDLPRMLNEQAYSPNVNRFLVYLQSIQKISLQSKSNST